MAKVKRNSKIISPSTNLLSDKEILPLPAEELFNRYGTTSSGLSDDESSQRLEVYGPNEVTPRGRLPFPLKILSHFKSPLTIILIFAAIISGVLGQPASAAIIILIVLVSVMLDFFQEYRAERTAEQLKQRVANNATVIRNNIKQDVPVANLVPGDVIFLSSGDIVPADARVVNARDLFADQSALTGESFQTEKTADPFPDADISDTSKWNNYLFMGTSVTNGAATAVVVKTGESTQYGEIVKKSTEKKPQTEFEKGLNRFGILIMQVTFVLVVAVFLINALFKHSVLDSLLFSVALAVGLTPELMPMILSMNLAKGASAMSKKGVIVKRMASIQNFGSMDILCSDKTGTLTENKVTVVQHIDFAGNDSEKVLLYSNLNSRYQSGLKSPLDDAIIKYREINTDRYKKIDEIPFDFIRKRLSVIVDNDSERLLITKGAFEEITKVLSQYELDGNIYESSEQACHQ